MSTTDSTPGKNRIRVLIAIAILVGAIILLFTVERAAIVPEPEDGTQPDQPAESGSTIDATTELQGLAAEPEPAEGPTAHRAFASTLIPPPATPRDAGVSPLADKLNAPAGTIREDLEIVGEIFANYREAFHEVPVGTNAEITAALAGDNSRGHAPLAADSSAINENGELVDRWDTPFFFHQMSANSIEVRSAGPDRNLYTADDVVWADGTIRDVPISVASTKSN